MYLNFYICSILNDNKEFDEVFNSLDQYWVLVKVKVQECFNTVICPFKIYTYLENAIRSSVFLDSIFDSKLFNVPASVGISSIIAKCT